MNCPAVSLVAVSPRIFSTCVRLDDAVGRAAPNVVIHAAALSSVDTCETNPQLARRVNVEATQNLLRVLQGHKCRFVFISTDSVFDGTRGSYAEDDVAAPVNVYGRTKLEAEEATLVSRSDSLVIRTAFYGRNLLPRESLSEWILNRLRLGHSVRGFLDAHFSPLLSTHLARLLLLAASRSVTGVLHLASSQGCSKYQFARELAAAAGFDPDRVLQANLESAALVAPRPRDVTLKVTRATQVSRRASTEPRRRLGRVRR